MSEQLFLEAFNSEPYFFEKEEKYGAMDIIYTFEDEAGHGFKFHFEKKVALGKHAYVCVLSQKTPGLKTYKRVIGKFSNPMRTVATLLAVVRDIHDTRKDVHGIVMSIPEQAFGSYSRLVKKIMTRELRTVLNVEDGEYTPEDFEKMGLVGIVTTVKPRNMNTVYTGPALKEYQERQAAKDGAGISTPAAVVPDVKAPSVAQTMPVQGAKPIKDINSLDFSYSGATRTISVQHGGDNDELYSFNGTDKQLFLHIANAVKIFVKNAKLDQATSTAHTLNFTTTSFVMGSSLNKIADLFKDYVPNVTVSKGGVQQPVVAQTMPAQVNSDGVTTIKFEVTKFDKDADTAFNANIFGRDSIEGGIALRLMRDKIKKIAGKTGQLPVVLARSIFMEGGTLKARFDSNLLAEVVAMIRSLEGVTLQFKGLERLEDLIPKQPVVDPVAVKDPYYFDYDHRQITLTFNDKETAGRIKDQLLELGAATFNDNEFFTDKEKLILVDGNALDVKKVQATLFPILGNPLMMNGVFADPNIRSSVRSPDGVIYIIKGNTIQVEDAPKDSAAKIVGMVIPGVERIFDDKGNNTIELNAAGIADGHEMFNFVKVLKSISINEELSRYVFMDWDSIAGDAMDKYDLSTSSFKSLATNDGQYLINDSYAGLVAEYTISAGNVINGVVFKSTYRASDRVTSLFSKDGYKVEHEVGGWGTQITIPLSSEFKLPAHDNLAKLIKELDNLSCFDRNRSVVEYVGGNRNFIAKFMPEDSRVGLRLPTDSAGYLAWRDYTSYATSPNFIRFDDIETLDQFQALVAKVKDFDFGANLLRNIGVSKYFADVRAGGPEAKKTYKLKDGGEVEITFEFGDKVMITFNQASQGFDKDLSEWVDEKNEIFGRISAIALYKLGTADANKTLKNIDAWLDAHIVSKEDNSSKVDFKYGDKVIVNNARSYNSMATSDKGEGVVELVSGGRVYVKIGSGQSIVDPKDLEKAEASKVSVPPTAPKSKNIVKPLISAIESVSKDGKEKKVTGFDLRVGETWAYDGQRGEMGNLLFISGPESTSLDSKIRSLGGAVLLRGVTRVGDLTIEFEDVAKKRKSKLTFTCGGLVQGSFEPLKGSFSPATKSKVDKLISKMFTDSPQAIANEFADFIGNPDLRYKIVKDARKPAILISKNPAGFKEALANAELLLESQLDEGIKEDLTGKAPNRVKRELLEATLQKLGFARESFTYGNATFKTVMAECAVEIIPTSGNIRNFAKMLGARLGQELRIDDEGFLSFDLDNI